MRSADRFALTNIVLGASAAAFTADVRAAGINLFLAGVALFVGWFDTPSPAPQGQGENRDG